MAATFECRIETEALEAPVRYQLKVDLQGKPIWKDRISNYLYGNDWTSCVSWCSCWCDVRCFCFLFCLHKSMPFTILKAMYMYTHGKTYDSTRIFISVRPRKVEVSGVRTHTVQGSTVSLLCRVMYFWINYFQFSWRLFLCARKSERMNDIHLGWPTLTENLTAQTRKLKLSFCTLKNLTK